MRQLLYIPILHSEQDMGSLAPALNRQSIELCGEERWSRHREVVSRFWAVVSDCLFSLETKFLRLYQDGIASDGQQGLKIVEEAARRGSPNHRLLLELIGRGAVLRPAEDSALLLMELKHVLKAIGLNPVAESGAKTAGGRGDPDEKERLLKARDRFIGMNISKTLETGEIGVLFLGAYHDVRPHLDRDIRICQVKEIKKVRDYFEALLMRRADWGELGKYLTAPVSVTIQDQ